MPPCPGPRPLGLTHPSRASAHRAATFRAEKPCSDVVFSGTHPGSGSRASHRGTGLGELQEGEREAGLLGSPKGREKRHLPLPFIQMLNGVQSLQPLRHPRGNRMAPGALT